MTAATCFKLGGLASKNRKQSHPALSCFMGSKAHMALALFDAITLNVSRALEALFDEVDYRLAKRALRHAAEAKAKRRSHTNVLSDEVMAIPSEAILS